MSASESVQHPTPPGGDQTERKLRILSRLQESAESLTEALDRLAHRLRRADTSLLWGAIALAAMTIIQGLSLIFVIGLR